MRDEIQLKDNLTRDFLDKKGLDGILLRRRDSFSWVTGGKVNHIIGSTEYGFVDLLITKDRKYCIANNVERFRINDEELDGLDYEILSFNWWDDTTQSIIKNIIGSGKLGCDFDFPGSVNVFEEFKELRYSLLPVEIDRYKEVSRLCARAVEDTCREIYRGETEHEICANLVHKVMANGIDPMVALVASDERIFRYRHPVATDKKIGRYAMVVVCGRKYGLVANLTRFVHFGEPSEEIRIKREKVLNIEAEFITNTIVGRNVSDIFKDGIKAYDEAGYPDEWNLLHQGGPTGYNTREYIVTPDIKGTVHLNQAFTWNPSISGTKSEDTFIVTQNGNEIITNTNDWPMVEVKSISGKKLLRPDLLILD